MEEHNVPDSEDLIIAALERGYQPNISFFAFTATPKYKTLCAFGRTGPDGKPEPFHLYSMRQAIEEQFILDVLAHYTTYKTYYKLVKSIEDDPEVDRKKAAKALARFMPPSGEHIPEDRGDGGALSASCHAQDWWPGKGDGRPDSRLAAVRYKQPDHYIAEHQYPSKLLWPSPEK